jgi:oligogalacturonide transport system substrate-binding protein
MKKAFVAVAIIVLSFGSLFANGTQEKGNAQPGKVALRMSWWGGDSRHKATLDAITAYEGKHPNISVSGEYSGWDGYYQKLVTQLAGGTAADVMQVSPEWLEELMSKGNVFAEIDTKTVDTSKFDKRLLDEDCTYNGKLVSMPNGISTQCMVIDRGLLQRSGIDPDTVWDWDKIISLGKKVHEKDPSCYFNASDPETFRYFFELYMAQVAGGIVDDGKNILCNKEQLVRAFTYFKQWFDLGIVEPFAQTSLYYMKWDQNPTWIKGKSASAFCWTAIIDMAGKQNMDVTRLPIMANAVDTGVRMLPAQLFTVNANSKHKQEAFAFLNYLYNDPDAISTLGICRGIPANSNALDQLSSEGKVDPVYSKATKIGLSVVGKKRPNLQLNTQVMQAMQDVIDEFAFGKLTPEQAADKFLNNLQNVLAEI